MNLDHDEMRLPPLRSLQVFEVAARHISFSRAADELGVTQGAVSRQVQELERWLGRELFRRSGPNLTLLPEGRALGEQVGASMKLLQGAIASVSPSGGSEYVTLSMLPSVAAKWLAPRLGRFLQCHPDIDLRITATRQFVDFVREGVDGAIRYGRGDWPGLTSEILAGESVMPVCSRAYANRVSLTAPGDMLRATLIHSDIEEDWNAWFRFAGVQNAPAPRGLQFGDDAAMLEAVLADQGVALGRSILVEEDLATGRLVAPFPQKLPTAFSYWFVVPADRPAQPDVLAVKDWLKAEFAARDRP